MKKMAKKLKKVKLMLIKMKTIQDVLSNTFNPNNTREKVRGFIIFNLFRITNIFNIKKDFRREIQSDFGKIS